MTSFGAALAVTADGQRDRQITNRRRETSKRSFIYLFFYFSFFLVHLRE
jgi:hypothetical protein